MLGLGHEFLGERPDDLVLGQHAAGGHADLPLMEPGAERDRRSRCVEIGVVQHDHRVLAAKLELHFFQMLACELADAPSHVARTGERHHGDVGIGADRFARLGAAGQHLQHALGQFGFLEDAGDDEAAGQRRARIGLEHHRIAGGERRRYRAHRQDQREVERRNNADDAARQAAGDADAAGVGGQHQALRLGAHGGGTIENLRHHVDFESGLGRDAASLARDPRDQLFLIVFQDPRRLAQDGAAFLIRCRRPAGLRGARLGCGLAHVGGNGIADAGKRGPGRRLEDVQRSAGGIMPLGAKQAAVPSAFDHEFRCGYVHSVVLPQRSTFSADDLETRGTNRFYQAPRWTKCYRIPPAGTIVSPPNCSDLARPSMPTRLFAPQKVPEPGVSARFPSRRRRCPPARLTSAAPGRG